MISRRLSDLFLPPPADAAYAAPCPHYGECGGCQIQHLPYDEQVARKARLLSTLFGRDVPVEPSPRPFHYRARMDFATAYGKVGMHRRGTHRRVVAIDACLLLSDTGNAVLAEARRLKELCGVPDYDINRATGFLKYLILREARSGEVMVICVTLRPDDAQERAFLQFAERLGGHPSVASIWWQIGDPRSDRIHAHRYRCFKQESISERLGPYAFQIGPDTFFQNNPWVAEQCFAEIRRWIDGDEVLDLYCGVGAIALSISDRARSVLGVEQVGEAVEQAQANARRNGVLNVAFRSTDVKEYLRDLRTPLQTVVVDPPRAGLGAKVIRRLLRRTPRRIIYMSCNPETQLSDMHGLSANSGSAVRGEAYRLVSLRGFDMFPQTRHLETVAVLDRVG